MKLHLQEYRPVFDFPHQNVARDVERDLITHLESVERLFLTPLTRPYIQLGEDMFFYGTWCYVMRAYIEYHWSDGKVVYVRHDDIDEEHWLSTENYHARRYFTCEPTRSIAEVGLEEYLGLNVLAWTDGMLGSALYNERMALLAQEQGILIL